MANIDIQNAPKILTEDSSFQLVRTNPKLTGNVKITINEAGDLWLESIKANRELSKDVYSKVPIDTYQSHASNVFRFFNNGQTPNEIIFDLNEQVDSTKTSNDYKDQYDFSHYFSGVKYLASNKYSERSAYFAPLYIKKQLPSFFVVVKLNDPSNFPLDQMKTLYESGQTKTDYLIDLFSKASIVKTFDLRPETKIGKYIRDYINSPNFPSSPLTVGFEENDYTTWNGILVDEGKLGYRGELLDSLYTSSQPLKSFEENITLGYSRHGIIFPDILNLEFIFNDDSSEKYDFNRYLGFYVNAIELSKLDIDLDYAYLNRGSWENTPHFRKKFLETDDVILPQSNSNGVIIPYKNSNINISEFNNIFSNSDNLFLNYISDKDNNLYIPTLNKSVVSSPYEIDYTLAKATTFTRSGLIVTANLASHGYSTDNLIVIASSDSEYSGEFLITKIDDNNFSYTVSVSPTNPTASGTSKKELNTGKIRLANNKIDLGLFFGQGRSIFLQDAGSTTSLPGYSHIMIEIKNNLNNYDEIRIYHPHGTRVDAIGKYDLIQSSISYSLIPNAGDTYVYNDYDNVLGYDEFYVNGSGYLTQVASAITTCINSIRNRTFTAYSYDEKVFIKLNSPGEFDAAHKVSFTSTTSNYSVLTIDGNTGIGPFNFKGGSKEKGNRLIIDAGHLDKINQNFDSILIKSSNSYSKIRKVSQYIDEITESNSVTKTLRSEAIDSYTNKITVVLDEVETPTISHNEFLMRSKFKPSFGLISFFSIKDLDLDFYSSTYANFPEIDLYNYYFIPENTNLLESGIDYIVTGGVIDINGSQILAGSTFTVPSTSAYSIVSGSPLVTFKDNPTINQSTIIPINDENGELNDFIGFSLLKDPDKVSQDITDPQIKYTNGLTQTEYDFYKENESLDFALRSKMVPYITKWGIKNGTDSRSNPYRLNTELAFGRNNFSPDHIDSSQNPLNFTHEWFYIESNFNYMNDDSTIAKNNYYFEKPFDYTGQLLTDPNYFINYFTYTPTNSQGKEIGDTQYRYSSLIKNSSGNYEAFFKGFKISFKDVNDPNVIGSDGKPLAKTLSNRFDGYKFSCILKPIKENIDSKNQPPIAYKVIEHTDFKFIVIVIEISLGYLAEIDPIWQDSSTPTFDTTNFNDSTLFTPIDPTKIYPFETINGDYRIQFDVNNVSNVTHTLLYSLRNKKYNNRLNTFSNIRLASKLNITSGGVSPNNTIAKSNNIAIPNYPSTLSEDLNNPTENTVIFIKDIFTGLNIFIDSKNSLGFPNSIGSGKLINIIDSVFDNYVHFDNTTYPLCLAIPVLPNSTSLYGNIPFGLESTIDNYYVFKVMSGGEKYFERLLEKISFAKFKKYVNEQTSATTNKIIEYYSYNNNSGIPVNDPNFYLEILDQSTIEKSNQVITNYATSIPTQFSGEIEIGSEYEVTKLPVKYELYRYKGEYEPVIKNHSVYKSNFKFTKNRINDLSLNNIRLNSDTTSIMTIDNFNHIKVSNNKILELESDDAYLPIYPKIGEISIGQGEYFLLRGNWDWGFHYKYLDKFQNIPVSGALRIEEDDSFLAKLITLPEIIELDQFDKTDESQFLIVTDATDLDTIDLSNREIIIKDTPDALTGIINLNNTLTRFLMEDGISTKFNEYLPVDTEIIGNFNNIDNYIKQYIKLNILKLYDLDINEFYAKNNASISSTNTQSSANPNGITFNFLNDSQRFTQGYTILKSLQINKKDRLVLKFSFTKKPGSGLSISPKIKIKFI